MRHFLYRARRFGRRLYWLHLIVILLIGAVVIVVSVPNLLLMFVEHPFLTLFALFIGGHILHTTWHAVEGLWSEVEKATPLGGDSSQP